MKNNLNNFESNTKGRLEGTYPKEAMDILRKCKYHIDSNMKAGEKLEKGDMVYIKVDNRGFSKVYKLENEKKEGGKISRG